MDYNQAPEAILVDLINETNGTAFLQQHLSFGVPEETLGEGDPRNTRVLVTAVPGSGYTDSLSIDYNRIDLAQLGPIDTLFFRSDFTRLVEMLPQINTRFGVLLTANDVEDADLPEPNEDGTPVEFLVQSKEGNLVWWGGGLFQLDSGAEVPEQARLTANGELRTTLDGKIRIFAPRPAE